jgi:F1F0 ATPase subunit 2
MDGERMSLFSFGALPAWAALASVAIHFAMGLALGRFYFHGLWRQTRRLVAGAGAATTIALMIARFALLGALLTFASLEGAAPLLALTLGVLIARRAVMRDIAEARP